MTIKDPLETETARLLPSSRTDPRTFFWDFTPPWRYILAILLAFGAGALRASGQDKTLRVKWEHGVLLGGGV